MSVILARQSLLPFAVKTYNYRPRLDVSLEPVATISFDEICVITISGNSYVYKGITICGGTIKDPLLETEFG